MVPLNLLELRIWVSARRWKTDNQNLLRGTDSSLCYHDILIIVKLVKEIDREYRVQSPESQSFRLTMPEALTEKANISEGEKLGISVKTVNGRSVIDFHKDHTSSNIVREVSGENKLVRIPAGIGGSMKIQRDMVRWALCSDDGKYVMRVLTSHYPLMISEDSWDRIGEGSFSDVDSNSFSVYIGKEMSHRVGWDKSTKIGFLLARTDSSLCIRCQPIEEIQDRISSTRVQLINKGGNNYRFYVPRDLVLATEHYQTEFSIFQNNDAIAMIKKA